MFKELAAKAQQAGTKLAAQVKEQQQKLAQKNSEGGGQYCCAHSLNHLNKLWLTIYIFTLFPYAASPVSPNDSFTTETENALRLVQIQNRTLRDRLRTTAEDNERLKDQLRQLSSHTPRAGDHFTLDDSPAAQSDPRMEAVLSENERLNDQVGQMKDLVRHAEDHAAAADLMAQQVQALQDELARVKELAAEERSKAARDVQNQLSAGQTELEKFKEEALIAFAAREAAEQASQQAQQD